MANTDEVNDLLCKLKDTIDDGKGTAISEASRAEALRLCQILRSTLVRPENAALEISFLPAYNMCARAAIQLGVFSTLTNATGAMTISNLAAETHAEPLLLERVLRMLATMGTVKQVSKDEYEATPVTGVLASRSMQAMHRHMWHQAGPAMIKFPEWLADKGLRCPKDPRDGLVQFAFGTNLESFEFWHQTPGIVETFNAAMDAVQLAQPSWFEWFPVRERLLEGIKFEDDSVILVDLAGGSGRHLDAFQKTFSPLTGRLILEELPAVVDSIKQPFNSEVEVMKHDIFQPQPIRGARVYFLSHIFHDWHDDPSLEILRHIAAAMTRGHSKLLINDIILPDVGCSFLQAGFDISMMALHAGMERSSSQWTALLDQAGFEVVKIWTPPGDGQGIIEAVLK